jgi:hypothetical protein
MKNNNNNIIPIKFYHNTDNDKPLIYKENYIKSGKFYKNQFYFYKNN